jgi:hypothetical protein
VGEPDGADSAISMHASLDLRHVYQANVVYLGSVTKPRCFRWTGLSTRLRVLADSAPGASARNCDLKLASA